MTFLNVEYSEESTGWVKMKFWDDHVEQYKMTKVK